MNFFADVSCEKGIFKYTPQKPARMMKLRAKGLFKGQAGLTTTERYAWYSKTLYRVLPAPPLLPVSKPLLELQPRLPLQPGH